MIHQQRNTRFRAPFALALLALTAVGMKADINAFAVLQPDGAASSNFGVLDLTTGAFTLINSSEPSGLTLASLGGSLYAMQELGNALFGVNPTTGALTSLGSLGNPEVLGATTSGLFDVDQDLNLNSLNASNGAATLVGATGTPGFFNWYALSNGGSALYISDEGILYSVNSTTGAATAIGGAPDPEIGALLFENGVLYGGDENASAIVTIDPTTGLASDPVAIQGAGIAGSFILGLAPDGSSTTPPSGVPEPSSVVLLATCAGIALYAGKHKFKGRLTAN
jgi:hypothetical protein